MSISRILSINISISIIKHISIVQTKNICIGEIITIDINKSISKRIIGQISIIIGVFIGTS